MNFMNNLWVITMGSTLIASVAAGYLLNSWSRSKEEKEKEAHFNSRLQYAHELHESGASSEALRICMDLLKELSEPKYPVLWNETKTLISKIHLKAPSQQQSPSGMTQSPGAPQSVSNSITESSISEPDTASTKAQPLKKLEPAASQVSQPLEVKLNLNPAGFWRRTFAFLIDSIIVIGFTVIIILSALHDAGTKTNFLYFSLSNHKLTSIPVNFPVKGSFNFDVPILIYFFLFWTLRSATIGQTALGMKIIREDGRPLDFRVALMRLIGFIISFIPVGIGLFWIGFNSKKQGWHDLFARTYVIKL